MLDLTSLNSVPYEIFDELTSFVSTNAAFFAAVLGFAAVLVLANKFWGGLRAKM